MRVLFNSLCQYIFLNVIVIVIMITLVIVNAIVIVIMITLIIILVIIPYLQHTTTPCCWVQCNHLNNNN